MIKARIFIVEDEALIVMELKDRLEKAGYEVCGTASRGEDALRQVAELKPELVLMDVRLAGKMDGIETAALLRDQSDAPVVYLSAFSDDELLDRAAATAPFGYLVKPFNEREVRATIDMAVSRSHLERQLRGLNRQLEASVDQLERQRRDIMLLHTMGESLQRCRTAADAYQVIGRSLGELFPRLPGFFAIMKPEARMRVEETWGDLSASTEFDAHECPVFVGGAACFNVTGEGGDPCSHVKKPKTKAFLCIPLVGQDRITAMLHFAHGDEAADLVPATVELAHAAAKTIELALGNIQLRESLNEQAIRDPLTGLHNRRYLQDMLEHEIAEASRSGAELGLLMLDLDHFKRFNDTHGHDAGDRLLQEFSRHLTEHTRQGDVACRYGGEEFVLILPTSPPDATRRRAEDIRRASAGLSFDYCDRTPGKVTVSIGIAQFPNDAKGAEQLLRAADQALYRAKAEGRNRVASASSTNGPASEGTDEMKPRSAGEPETRSRS